MSDTDDILYVCDENNTHPATWYCIKCEMMFCEECKIETHSAKVFANHEIVPIADRPEAIVYCPIHPKNIAELYCTDDSCKILRTMCTTCHQYGQHKNHPFVLLDAKHQELRDLQNLKIEETKNFIRILNGQLEQFGRALNLYDAEKTTTVADKEKAIKELTKKVREHIDYLEETTIDNLRYDAQNRMEEFRVSKNPFCEQLGTIQLYKGILVDLKMMDKNVFMKNIPQLLDVAPLVDAVEIDHSWTHVLDQHLKKPFYAFNFEPMNSYALKLRSDRKLTIISNDSCLVDTFEAKSEEVGGARNLREYKKLYVVYNECNYDGTCWKKGIDAKNEIIIIDVSDHDCSATPDLTLLKKILVDVPDKTNRIMVGINKDPECPDSCYLKYYLDGIIKSDHRVSYKFYDAQKEENIISFVDFALNI